MTKSSSSINAGGATLRKERGRGRGAPVVGRLRVYFEEGSRTTFAVALDWPGWCRRGAAAEAALESLEAYRPRYLAVVGGTGLPGEVEIVGRVCGNSTTDFGAPGAIGSWDEDPIEPGEMRRQALVVAACWSYFDATAAAAPAALRKGPRGGGRDTAGIVAHVRETEHVYASKVGIRMPRSVNWEERRSALMKSLVSDTSATNWPRVYALRRVAWHLLDHAWEIQDRS